MRLYLLGAALASLLTIVAGATLLCRMARRDNGWARALAGFGAVLIVSCVLAWAFAFTTKNNYVVRWVGDVAEQAAAVTVLTLWLRSQDMDPLTYIPAILWGVAATVGAVLGCVAGLEPLRTMGALALFGGTLCAMVVYLLRGGTTLLRKSIVFWVLVAFILRFPAQVTTANWRHILVDQRDPSFLWLYMVVSVLPGALSSFYLLRAATSPHD